MSDCGRDDTEYSTTIEGITLCSIQPFTDDEKKALAAYFRLLRKAKGIQDLDETDFGPASKE